MRQLQRGQLRLRVFLFFLGNPQRLLAAIHFSLQLILTGQPVQMLLVKLLAGEQLFFFVSERLQTFIEGMLLLRR